MCQAVYDAIHHSFNAIFESPEGIQKLKELVEAGNSIITRKQVLRLYEEHATRIGVSACPHNFQTLMHHIDKKIIDDAEKNLPLVVVSE